MHPMFAPALLTLLQEGSGLPRSAYVIGGVVLAVIVLLVVVDRRRKARLAAAEAERRAAAEGPRPMSTGRFWELVASAREAAGPDPLHRPDHLQRALRALDPDEVAAFNAAYGKRKVDAYTEDLRMAAHLILGGADETAFSHFRDWLLSEGREVYEAALEDPNSLADCGTPEVRRLEPFAYAAKRAYKAAAARPMPGYAFVAEHSTRAAEWDEATARERFPRLAR